MMTPTSRPLALAAAAMVASAPSLAASTAQPADLFDFWLGDWTVTWTNANGTAGHGRNHVARILDGNVIEERFEQDAADPPPRLLGRSLSVLQASTGTWRQAWADNQGAYFSFTGSADGERRVFATGPGMGGDPLKGQRMVFKDIRPDAFTWDWEATADGGKTWTLSWRLNYQRDKR